MPLPWWAMGFAEKAEAILNDTDLHEGDFASVYDEWAEGEYDLDDPRHEERALSDLYKVAIRHILQRAGRDGEDAVRRQVYLRHRGLLR